MKHVVFYSGGLGSWATANRVIERFGKEDVVLLFTDTLIEDEDLYRFLDETEKDFGIPVTRVEDGRDPWQVFKDVRWLGNSRIAQCSHLLKQKTAEKWIKANCSPEDTILYLGIDWTEAHRTKKPREHWDPYPVEFPMCEEPFLTKEDIISELEKREIKIPRLYEMNFAHNNCGGMCVRGGQAHWINLLRTMPERYAEAERKEQEIRDFLNKDITILTRTVKGQRQNLSLKQLREENESAPEQIDMFDVGGCGCFVSD